LSVLFLEKQVLIAAEGELLVLDIDKKEVVHSIHAPSYIMVMALSPDHSQLLVSTYHDGLVLYSVEDWSCKRSYWLPGAGAPQAVRWAADSRAVFIGTAGDNGVYYLDIESGAVTELARFRRYCATESVEVSSDGTTVYAAESDGRVWRMHFDAE